MSDLSNSLKVASKFLQAQAARDYESARPLAHDSYTVVSPGGRETGLEALFERLSAAYKSLQKIPVAQDVTHSGDVWKIYTHGTMAGERADGQVFEGVRFLDLIVVRDGLVERQEIWNDFGHPVVK